MKETNTDIVVVGAGIVGLAMAYHCAKKGYKVAVVERTERAIGASIRNFGLIWPVGQPAGTMLDRALRSRRTWLEIAPEAGIWINRNGSLQLAYHGDEWAVIEEFYSANRSEGFQIDLLGAAGVKALNTDIKLDGLKGGLYSHTECTVDPREAIAKLPAYLERKYGVTFHFGRAVQSVEGNVVKSGNESWKAEKVFVCSGADFETLFPETFKNSGITKCKLQMMRTGPQPIDWKLGPSLSAGLTLLHYSSFRSCPGLGALRSRIESEMPEYVKWGIHVLVSQNALGEIVLGDSHEYGLTHSPFDREEINRLVISYLSTFLDAPDLKIEERWHGIYPKLNGKTDFVAKVDEHTTIVNGHSGAGMTLSFGLAEEIASTF